MYIVDGFLFEDEATAELAKKEEEGVRFIKERTDLNNAEVVFKVYSKLLEQNLFVTPVGLKFLMELQNIVVSFSVVPYEEIPPIKIAAVPVIEQGAEKENENNDRDESVKEQEKVKAKRHPAKKVTKKKDKNVEADFRRPFYISLFFAIIFGMSVIGMFFINELSSNSVNIINYREEILDEYAQWQTELQEKEAELKEWEKVLNEREAQLEAY